MSVLHVGMFALMVRHEAAKIRSGLHAGSSNRYPYSRRQQASATSSPAMLMLAMQAIANGEVSARPGEAGASSAQNACERAAQVMGDADGAPIALVHQFLPWLLAASPKLAITVVQVPPFVIMSTLCFIYVKMIHLFAHMQSSVVLIAISGLN